MITERDLGGVFKWVAVDEELILVDPRYLEEFLKDNTITLSK